MVRYHSKTTIIASIDCTMMSAHLPIDEKAAAVGRRPMKASAIGDTFIVFVLIGSIDGCIMEIISCMAEVEVGAACSL